MADEKPSGFAARLRSLREAAGVTQSELAERAGLHKLGVAKLEQGLREPAWATVQALARALGVNCGAFEIKDGEEKSSASAAKKGPGRPRKATADAATSSVEEVGHDGQQAKTRPIKKGRKAKGK